MKEQYTYTDAFEELQSIVAEIEQGAISVDELAEKVKRASQLIQVCKVKLNATEEEVNQVLAGLTATETAEPDSEAEEEA
ncbi:exodeoxyribonuclease VII small subunit [Parapedobacter lycopersici]|uniref:exodeoxyribonuclease VII small subunit n=1 Tax=Parapedobacter lycopersici TaxID=1864939 RepID=UPI00214D8680|nr:exodeoxyribonuclease VII small subunit [Parapedobacter lycopersici]